MNRRVAILYGLGEGPRISGKLRKNLQDNNFEVTNDAAEADIIIAHSGGCLFLPDDLKAKIVLLVAPSNGYKYNLLALNQLHKMAADSRYSLKNRQTGWWIYKSFWNFTHLITSPKVYREMLSRARKNGRAIPNIKAKRLGVILYRGDFWSWFGDQKSLLKLPNASLISHPGIHDDIWINPAGYISVLQYLYET